MGSSTSAFAKNTQTQRQNASNLTNQLFTEARTPSRFYDWQSNQFDTYNNLLANRDFRGAPIIFNLAQPSQQIRDRNRSGLYGQGAYSFGAQYANPTALALGRERLNADSRLIEANAYQQQMQDYDMYNRNLAENLRNYDLSRSLSLLSPALSREQFYATLQNTQEAQKQQNSGGWLGNAIGGAQTALSTLGALGII